MSSAKVVIVGARLLAARLHVYLTADAGRDVVAFAVHREYLREPHLAGLPVVPLEELEGTHPPDEHEVCVALGYVEVNAARARACDDLIARGYGLVSYRSSLATIWDGAVVGARNTLVMDRTVVGPYATVGDDVLLNGCNVNHHAAVEDHCFIGTGATIGGEARVGERSFVGLNATIRNGVTVAPRTVVGAGVVVKHDTEEGDVLSAPGAEKLGIRSWELRDPF